MVYRLLKRIKELSAVEEKFGINAVRNDRQSL